MGGNIDSFRYSLDDHSNYLRSPIDRWESRNRKWGDSDSQHVDDDSRLVHDDGGHKWNPQCHHRNLDAEWELSTFAFNVVGTLKILTGQNFGKVSIANTTTLLSGIAFNSLFVSSSAALVQGAIAVTRLTITNSETTAITTIPTFTVWSVDKQYGWSHTSSSTTTLITFSMSGNVTSATWQAFKNDTLFANGNVQSSVVSFTMQGSDPSMLVVLAQSPSGDVPLIIVWLFIFAFLLLLVFGFLLHPLFWVFDGIEGIFMSYQVWVFTGSEPLGGIFFGFSIMVLVWGIFRFVEEEVL